MLRLTTDAPDAFKGRKVHFAIFDSVPELANFCAQDSNCREKNDGGAWTGSHTKAQSIEAARNGDLSGVERSDALLAKMETYELATARRAWTNDVCGSIPDVPAFIAGHPLAMRRRHKVANEAAPIAIIVDLTSSAGLNADQIAKRGSAILALVRALSARRPVELWVCCALDADNCENATFVMARVETAPLDLSIAAHVLTHAGFPRNLMYGIGFAKFAFRGRWPFGKKALSPADMAACLAPVMQHVTETVCLPGIHALDESVNNPEAWLAAQIAQHAPQDAA